jgi:hypothetical protein
MCKLSGEDEEVDESESLNGNTGIVLRFYYTKRMMRTMVTHSIVIQASGDW